MPYNGAGVFSLYTPGNPVVTNTTISSIWANNTLNDLATGLSTAVTKDGQTTVTANLPMAGFKITGIGAATARTDAASLATIQDGTGIYVATVGGTADAITLTPSPAITSYVAGQAFYWIASGANTGAATLQVSGIGGAKALTKSGSTALAAGDIPSGSLVGARYDGTRFQLVSAVAGISASILAAKGDLISATAAATPAVLTVGTDGQVLVAASGQATGLQWQTKAATNAAAGFIEIAIQSEVDAGTSTTLALVPSLNRIALGTEQASTSGTTIDFTGIPSGTRRITVMGSAVSTNGTSGLMVQIGVSGGIENSGYTGGTNQGSTPTAFTTGFGVMEAMTAANGYNFKMVIDLENAAAFRWIASSSCIDTAATQGLRSSAGSKALAAVLDRVRITMFNGTDAFDAGVINISYER